MAEADVEVRGVRRNMAVHLARSRTASRPCAPDRMKRWGEIAQRSRAHFAAGILVAEVAGARESQTVCSSIIY